MTVYVERSTPDRPGTVYVTGMTELARSREVVGTGSIGDDSLVVVEKFVNVEVSLLFPGLEP